MTLKPFQKRYLRGQAHHLRAFLHSGAKGITESFLSEVGLALNQHELIKVKLSAVDRDERATMIAQVAQATRADIVQVIGHTVTLFRRNPEEPKIALPA